MLRLQQGTALDLELQGSAGSFQVGASGRQSLEVKYFLTHVGLNFSSPSNDKLLSNLAPVREIFDFQSLDFDEIVQRDIDDARVSAELVPYLLDRHSKDLIKLFPPIVIVVMPIQEGRTKPDRYYAEVRSETLEPNSGRDHHLLVTRSGAVGREIFQFEQPVLDGMALRHDMVRLRLNTSRTRLVIVDGQHRAMALLAIYRNLKDQWSDERRSPFKEYYTAWTPNFIANFNLNEINLPVILCTVPSLDENYKGDFDMQRAARSIFLTLNKTARQVSDARNKLLDDNDIISFLMRRTLSEIKNKDSLSPAALRITNVELDQDANKIKLQAPVAMTGIPHVYYVIEHMMLDSGSVRGVAPRAGTFYNRTKLHDLLERLNGRNLLGRTTSNELRRDLFPLAAAETLGREYDRRYGAYVVGAYERFAPFDFHNRAVLDMREQLEHDQDRQLKPILLEGQGIGRVFEAHRSGLRQKLKQGYFNTDVPEVNASLKRLDATSARIEDAVSRLRRDRATRLVAELPDKRPVRQGDAIHPKAVDWTNRLYDEVFTSVAFQAALVCGFLGLVERAEREVAKGDHGDVSPLDRDAAFDDYVTKLNAFFVPKSTAHLRRLVQTFAGEVSNDDLWTVRPSNQTFRAVVHRGEMQPDQWPKYRYLLLELWEPAHPVLSAVVSAERRSCRGEVFAALRRHYLDQYRAERRMLDSELSDAEREEIFRKAVDTYNGLLKSLAAPRLDEAEMRTAAAAVPAAMASGETDDDEASVDDD